MAKIIRGNNDGSGSGNDSYRIPGRSASVSRLQLVREVEQGLHPNHSTYTLNGQTYVRAKPNSSNGDNVNNN